MIANLDNLAEWLRKHPLTFTRGMEGDGYEQKAKGIRAEEKLSKLKEKDFDWFLDMFKRAEYKTNGDFIKYFEENFESDSAQSKRFRAALEEINAHPVLKQLATPETIQHYLKKEYVATPETLMFALYASADKDIYQFDLHNWMHDRGLYDTDTAEKILNGMSSLHPEWVNYNGTLDLHTVNLRLDMIPGANTQNYNQQIFNEIDEVRKKYEGTDQWMKAPNGKPTHLTEKQWLLVRTPSFKRWFGDWEKAANIKKLKNSQVVNVSFNNQFELNPKAASKFLQDNIRGEYINDDTGGTIIVSRQGTDEVLSHDRYDVAHLKALTAIPDLIKHSIFITEISNEKGNGKYNSYKYFVCGLKIGKEDYTAKIVVGVKNNKQFYDQALSKIEKGALIDTLDNQSSRHQSEPLFDIKDSRLLDILQDNSSKVVDENDEPLVVYHVTDATFDTFDMSKARQHADIPGAFFSEEKSDWRDLGKNVMPVFLRIVNPVNKPVSNGKGNEILTQLKAKGYDGTIAQEDGMETEYAVFNPTQIKSATDNNGNFDPSNANIYNQSTLGQFTPASAATSNVNVITLFDKADASTVIHETGHYFLETMYMDVMEATADGSIKDNLKLKKDFDTLMEYAGTTTEKFGAMSFEERRAVHEKIAEAFETYLMTGKAPSLSLRSAFRRFKNWLLSIYRDRVRSDNAVSLTPEVSEVFDRMLATDDEVALMQKTEGYLASLPKQILDKLTDANKDRLQNAIAAAAIAQNIHLYCITSLLNWINS